MATQIIDTTVKGATIPANSQGTLPGHAITQGNSVNRTDGYFTSTGDAVEIRTGFKARKVTIINDTDGITWEKFRGMADANTIKMVLGGSLAGTKDTGSAIAIADRTVTLSAALVGTAKNIVFHIED